MLDGGSTGATILLAAGPGRIAVDVNWLTGRVRSPNITEKSNYSGIILSPRNPDSLDTAS
jgi:hypothetical protein